MKIYQYLKNYIGFFLVTAIVAGCTTEGKQIIKENEQKSIAVETAVVRKQPGVYTLSLPGEVKPFQQVQLYPKVTGFVQKIYVDRGSKVKKGQLLARLEAPEITQKYLAASAKQTEVVQAMRYSLQAYKRLEQASESAGAVAKIELEEAYARLMGDSATYQALKAEMAAAQQLTDYLEIRAPFTGVITDRRVSPGALVGANEKPLFTLAEQDRLRLTIAIPAKHARSLSDSAQITYKVNSYPDKIFTAQFARSSRVLDESLRSLIVEFDIQNHDRQLNGGEYIQAQVEFQRPGASLWVPSSSIIHASSGVFLLKVVNNTIEKIAVTEGIRTGMLTEVFGNLHENDTVVVDASEELREGTIIHSK